MDSESDLSNKQPRKKRGRYRQYNTELLEEAIVVVMGGKMSVSKAQSIYGIPHSTLEYKVKERLGTLKNPPKKKMKLGQMAEPGVSLSPKQKDLQNSQHSLYVKKESASEENGTDFHDGRVLSNEWCIYNILTAMYFLIPEIARQWRYLTLLSISNSCIYY